MQRLNTVEEFISFRQQVIQSPLPDIPRLVVCAGTGGQASGANDLIRIIKRYILEQNLQEKVALKITGCQGFCELDPFIIVEPGKHLYPRLNLDDVPLVIDAAVKGKVEEKLVFGTIEYKECNYCKEEIPFFKKQMRTILGMNEVVDPIRIYDYIRSGGYEAICRVLQDIDPVWIIEEIKKSGLRGRGGAGFPTGKKWEFAYNSGNGTGHKYLICNADEGDPGAYMDRSLLEGNPHAIFEGMFIAGLAIGATQGLIYVRSEYPLAIKHTLIALRQAREMGLLGKNILGTGVDFDIDIVRGAGAFVCGEETALIRSIEGKIGEPRQRPPYPVQKGLWGMPTCINNVETLANVPIIIQKGAEEYAKAGVPGNSGTKIFSLVGKVKNTGLVEVPMGTSIAEIVYDIGGGSNSDKKIKAVQTGGPSGGCIPADMFDLSIDYESLAKAGSIMGSGGMIVMDENTCMVDVAKYFMKFLMDESCGKCFTCRKGTQRMYELLDDITKGNATLEHLDLLEELALVVRDTTMCGLGQSAPNPVLSTLQYFKEEYKTHILEQRCNAFVCSDLVGAPCHAACPIETEAWRYVAHIANGDYEQAYLAIRETNPFPSVCARVCDHKCESRCRLGQTGTDPVAIRNLKRFITDRIDPSIFKPEYETREVKDDLPIAIIGAGPAGLTAAHYLSLKGYKSTVFDSASHPGGMLFSCIPSYRLPRETLTKEIDSILDDNITLKMNAELGKDISIDGLLKEGFKAVFVGIGAQKGRKLALEGEDSEGVLPSIEFLKAHNIEGKSLAKGKVGVIGGGNSAIDAARTALRQEGVESVTILYRRSREEMPAFEEEIEAAIEEGIKLETLVTPVKVLSTEGTLTGIKCVRNRLGALDSSGRRRPVPIDGSEFPVWLDTLIVAISESPDVDSVSPEGAEEIQLNEWGTIWVDPNTLQTSRRGVFAGGDVVTGPNTVVDAIAAGKRVAIMIDRFFKNEDLDKPIPKKMPVDYVAPQILPPEELAEIRRAKPPALSSDKRKRSFEEVELSLSEQDAKREAMRCLRCDLEFTEKIKEPAAENVKIEIKKPAKVG